jgi:hypothetical protein
VQTKEHQQLISKRMELKPKGISAIEVAGQPVRLKVALKLLDAILTLSSILVMVKDLLGSARSVGNHKAQIGAQRTDFNFNDNFSVFGPASGSVPKAIKNLTVWWLRAYLRLARFSQRSVLR